MRVFDHLSIKARLAATMLLLSLLLILVGVLGVSGMTASNRVAGVGHTEQLPGAIAIGETQAYTLRQRISLDRAMMIDDQDKIDSLLQLSTQVKTQANAAWTRYASLPKSAEEQQLAAGVAEQLETVQGIYDALSSAIKDKDRNRMVSASDQAFKTFVLFQRSCDALNAYRSQTSQLAFVAAQREFLWFFWVTVLALVAGVLSALLAFLSIRRAIVRPLTAALKHFNKISDGDLTAEVHVGRRDEMGDLLVGLEQMRMRLVDTVGTVRGGSGSIAAAAQEISTGNIDLSARTEEQAASLEETSSSMQLLAGSVNASAEHSQHARALANDALSSVTRGQSATSSVTTTMEALHGHSKRMTEIVSIIESIAFQTNILALNASVEAARGGEHGRGFAVVAAEVRALAERSSKSSGEVKQLIHASMQLVEEGSTSANSASDSMIAILDDVRKLGGLVSEISDAAKEQAHSIGEMALATAQMDSVTQQNAALVEQVAAASQALEDQTLQLERTVSTFKLPKAR